MKTGRDYVLPASMRFDVRGYPRPGKNILFFFFARSKSRVSRVIRNTPPGNIYIYVFFRIDRFFFGGYFEILSLVHGNTDLRKLFLRAW